jgi:AmmeMemoRadiSam system protein B
MKRYEMRLPNGWYPHSPQECKKAIGEMIQGFNPPKGSRNAGIVPHAGWYFSGKLAARVFRTLAANNPEPDAVCLIGGHLAESHPVLYIDDAVAETPLGEIEIQKELTNKVIAGLNKTMPDPNEGDNTVEVNLPFIKYFFPHVPLIAFRSPPSPLALELGKEIFRLSREEKLNIVVIGAADLTHYGPNYGFTPKGTGEEALEWVREENDKQIVDSALEMKARALLEHGKKNQSSCSSGAMAAVAAYAGSISSASPELIDYYTSYDIHPGSSFVGYAGIVY